MVKFETYSRSDGTVVVDLAHDGCAKATRVMYNDPVELIRDGVKLVEAGLRGLRATTRRILEEGVTQ